MYIPSAMILFTLYILVVNGNRGEIAISFQLPNIINKKYLY